MRSKRKDKYIAFDIINIILCIALLILAGIVFFYNYHGKELIPFIVLLGAIINLLSAIKGFVQKNGGKLFLFVAIILILIAIVIFLDFGGF